MLRGAQKKSFFLGTYAILCFAWVLLGFASAQSPETSNITAELAGSKMQGFERVIMTFNKPVAYKVNQTNQIVTIFFENPNGVAVSVKKLQAQLPDIISAARVDPNNAAVRLALRKAVKLSVKDAAESVYIDLLPTNWSGPNPPLPDEVVENLAKRAREASEKIKEYEARPKVEIGKVVVRGFASRYFTRIVFVGASKYEPTLTNDGNSQRVKFNTKVNLDISSIISDLPENIVDVKVEQDEAQSALLLVMKSQNRVQAFKEEQDFIVDVFPKELEQKQKTSEKPKTEELTTLPVPVVVVDQKSPQEATVQDLQAPKIETPSKQSIPQEATQNEGENQSANLAMQDLSNQNQLPIAIESPKLETQPQNLPTQIKPNIVKDEILSLKDNVAPAPSIANELKFEFSKNTPAAVFEKNNQLWIVFATNQKNAIEEAIRISQYADKSEVIDKGAVQIIKLQLATKGFVDVQTNNKFWHLKISDAPFNASNYTKLERAKNPNGQDILRVSFPESEQVIEYKDPLIGDDLIIVTALAPIKSVVEQQDYLELTSLKTSHGLAFVSKVTDLKINNASNYVELSRQNGLLLSNADGFEEFKLSQKVKDELFSSKSTENWSLPLVNIIKEHFRHTSILKGIELENKRHKMAQHYIARGYGVEAYGILRSAQRDNPDIMLTPKWQLVQLATHVLLNKPDEALKLFSQNRSLEFMPEGAFWYALASSDLQKYTAVRQAYPTAIDAVTNAPKFLRSIFWAAVIRAEIEAGNTILATKYMSEYEQGQEFASKQFMMVMNGRIAESFGNFHEAFDAYRTALKGTDKKSYYEARLRSAMLRLKTKQVTTNEIIEDLEKIAIAWRGDSTEVQALNMLTHLYDEQKNLRQSFASFKRLQEADVIGTEQTRKLYDHMSKRFEQIFLSDEADNIPPQEALALYYDFKHLTPVGRKGDEMIRKIADRLVELDLLVPAIDLLSHQVKFRLSGAARSQIAAKLAFLQLKAKKPADALATLQETRLPDLPTDLLQTRTVLEAKALSEAGRSGLALEVLKNLKGDDIDRLKADILWRTKEWLEAAETLEKLMGDRWKSEEALNDQQVNDVLRAAVGYALANDDIGTFRMRSKFGSHMSKSTESKAFEVVTVQNSGLNPDVQLLSKKLNTVDNMQAFLNDFKKRMVPFNQEPPAPKTAP